MFEPPEIGGISHSDWDPADEDWGRGRRMGALTGTYATLPPTAN
jgi:hypothetical protein